MPPNQTESTEDPLNLDLTLSTKNGKHKIADNRKPILVWRNIILFIILHISGVYGAYLLFTQVMWKTFLFTVILYYCSGFGITAGAHRLWAHRSYKARLPLKITLMLFNTIAFQDSVIEWARDHRMHHKYSETDADPHNATRGFFFSHIGWLLCKKHPEIKAKGHTVDMSDLYSDPILKFQHNNYIKLMVLMCFVMPTFVPVYFWGETAWNAWFTAAMFRYTFVLNATWLVNSAAHMFGKKPYDHTISPSENLSVANIALGEGFHNYHHTFPWDYKTGEFGHYSTNFTRGFIDFMAKIGWAYDLKTASKELIRKRIERTGDGSHHIWGWGDRDQDKEELENATRIYK